MITHDEAISILKNGSDGLYSYQTLEIIKTLERAKKEHELLRSHIKLAYYANYNVDDIETKERVLELKDEIIQLKKELGEMNNGNN